MGSRVTSHDVARLAGVSRSAVSLVVNGRADGIVSEENQDAVRRAARELGYRPNSVARSLRNATSHTIGVFTDWISTGTFGGDMLAGAAEVASQAGYLLLTLESHGDPGAEDEAIEVLRARQCDALLFAGSSLREWTPPPSFIAETSLLLDAIDPSGTVPGVVSDERLGGERATQVLLDAGHREVTYLAGTDDVLANRMRVVGHQEAIARAGARSTLVTCGWEIDKGLATGTRVLDVEHPPTAVLCANDRVAAGVFLAAARLGLRIPDDLSVVGYDDDPNVASQLGLTTILLPHREMGAQAATLLLGAIAGEDLPTHDVVVDAPVVHRSSVAPPRG